jgi:hypothetical protein
MPITGRWYPYQVAQPFGASLQAAALAVRVNVLPRMAGMIFETGDNGMTVRRFEE